MKILMPMTLTAVAMMMKVMMVVVAVNMVTLKLPGWMFQLQWQPMQSPAHQAGCQLCPMKGQQFPAQVPSPSVRRLRRSRIPLKRICARHLAICSISWCGWNPHNFSCWGPRSTTGNLQCAESTAFEGFGRCARTSGWVGAPVFQVD